MNIVYDLVTDVLQNMGAGSYEGYSKCLRAACQSKPPPHGMDWYRERYFALVRDPVWFANSLMVNAQMEGYGSTRVWAYADRLADTKIADLVRSHAIDESRHSRMFVMMLDLTFPQALDDEELRSKLEGLSPGYTRRCHPEIKPLPADQQVSEMSALDELIQINITEVRALILQHYLRPAILAHSPPEASTNLSRFCASLMLDESRHIEYTAGIIERAISQGHGEFVSSTMIERQANFNEVTSEEVERENCAI